MAVLRGRPSSPVSSTSGKEGRPRRTAHTGLADHLKNIDVAKPPREIQPSWRYERFVRSALERPVDDVAHVILCKQLSGKTVVYRTGVKSGDQGAFLVGIDSLPVVTQEHTRARH